MHNTSLFASAAACPRCGRPETGPFGIVSAHRTSQGVVTYARCACGALRVQLSAPGDARARVIWRGRETAGPRADDGRG